LALPFFLGDATGFSPFRYVPLYSAVCPLSRLGTDIVSCFQLLSVGLPWASLLLLRRASLNGTPTTANTHPWFDIKKKAEPNE